jgi:hypothetical protein
MEMKKVLSVIAILLLVAVGFMVVPSGTAAAGPVSGQQTLINMRFISAGPTTNANNVLQVGQVNTLSAAVATATLTKVLTGPSTGSAFIAGILVEKATASTGSLTVKTGTGTNCGTATATLLGPISVPPVGYIPMNIQATAASDVCLQTDASTTSVRLLGN